MPGLLAETVKNFEKTVYHFLNGKSVLYWDERNREKRAGKFERNRIFPGSRKVIYKREKETDLLSDKQIKNRRKKEFYDNPGSCTQI